jgi:nanoRNase/pAp phosphatase (c-di-AMP/oligoRNAs hydrolase)
MVNIDDAIAAYIKLREKKAQIKAEAEAKANEISVKLDKLEGWIKERADENGVTSFKTKHGTAFLTTVDFATVADWDAMLTFVKQNDAYDMLEKRVSKTAVRGYIDQLKAVPPGVNYGTRIEVNVRKPTAKEE